VNQGVTVQISLDGQNFVNVPGTFTYKDVNPGTGTTTSSPSSALAVSATMLVALLLSLLL